MSPIRRIVSDSRRGEDCLSELESVELTLESGKRVKFRVEREVGVVDDDVDTIRHEALRAPSRLVFWMYQTERALGVVRRLEREYESSRGIYYREIRAKHKESGSVLPLTEPMVVAQLDSHPQLYAMKNMLDNARQQYNVVRSIAQATEHRCYLLRRLLHRDSEPT